MLMVGGMGLHVSHLQLFEKHTVLTNKCSLIQFGMVGGT
jgi:hypothetical protein